MYGEERFQTLRLTSYTRTRFSVQSAGNVVHFGSDGDPAIRLYTGTYTLNRLYYVTIVQRQEQAQ